MFRTSMTKCSFGVAGPASIVRRIWPAGRTHNANQCKDNSAFCEPQSTYDLAVKFFSAEGNTRR